MQVKNGEARGSDGEGLAAGIPPCRAPLCVRPSAFSQPGAVDLSSNRRTGPAGENANELPRPLEADVRRRTRKTRPVQRDASSHAVLESACTSRLCVAGCTTHRRELRRHERRAGHVAVASHNTSALGREANRSARRPDNATASRRTATAPSG